MRIGLEACYGFGDICLNLPLIQTISAHYGFPVDVAVRADCADAFDNVPFIRHIHHCKNLWEGHAWFKSHKYDVVHQITQNVKFFEFRQHGPHSLVDTPSATGRQLGLPAFDPRPQIYLRADEIAWADEWMADKKDYVILEAVYKSGQSWCDERAVRMIINAHRGKVLWASHTPAPAGSTAIPASRRHVIACIRHCRKFYSVGSGIFCGALALDRKPPITCMWIDDLYKYEQHVRPEWAKITWVHDHEGLASAL